MQVNGTGAVGASAAPAAGAETRAGLQKAAQQFEAIFLRQMIGSMRSASLAEGITDSSATEQFQSMADSRTADALAGKGSMGIAELLMKQFGARMSDATQPTASTPPAAKADGK